MTCAHCEFRIFRDERDGVFRHYWNDSEFCQPGLAHLDAFGQTATPEEGP